jgi:hypothetical protein
LWPLGLKAKGSKANVRLVLFLELFLLPLACAAQQQGLELFFLFYFILNLV